VSISNSGSVKSNNSLAGRIGALESWARTEDRSARTAPARAAFNARFDAYPDPVAARKAYFARLALASAKARRKKAA
jgi:hypothetical protein